jgi:parvulin-like peptidyl-prolyl isomerase
VAVFDLKPGEVSQVISDATGYYIYKLDAQQVLPLNAVRNEITETLRDRNMREAMQEIQDSFTTEMNAAYFGDSETPVSRRSQPAPGETRPTPRR